MTSFSLSNFQSQIRKGSLEFIVLLVISHGPVYASDIIAKLYQYQLIVVEGTIYPLLTRLKNAGLLKYDWQESTGGPPRKYYSLTTSGQSALVQLISAWTGLEKNIDSLIKNSLEKNEKNSNR